jgi:hypothetical protein
MGGVEDDRGTQLAHLDQTTIVDDKAMVAEGVSSLCQQHVVVAAVADLLQGVPHVLGREELSLLDVDDPAGLGRGHQKVGLTAQERRDLQDVADFAGGGGLCALVDIGQHRQLELVPHRREHGESDVEARAAIAVDRGPVGLVEARLEHEG